MAGADEFLAAFGPPRAGTAGRAAWPRALPDVDAALAITGSGLFADGLLGLASVREVGLSLDGWPVPPAEAAVPFLSTAMGVVFARGKQVIWVIDSWEGSAFDSDMSVDELLSQLASEDSRNGTLDWPGYKGWLERSGPLPDTSILQPKPLPILGGSGAISSCHAAEIKVHMDIVRQLL
ncbi:T6SS immunity protein Tdi1 domain-containing protein [Sandarakinorhabdus oryzae]|uniref:T6SS immunity protein Tdi1 domain-containing protein n=1 Tax=Sandarakinorhabdus oryzae TaxID=2675220 RepID=UPI0012E278A8|nr:T6SS immunity protein Tdi1 domain-containing protein [Sandarakinorhabdus oryzae]